MASCGALDSEWGRRVTLTPRRPAFKARGCMKQNSGAGRVGCGEQSVPPSSCFPPSRFSVYRFKKKKNNRTMKTTCFNLKRVQWPCQSSRPLWGCWGGCMVMGVCVCLREGGDGLWALGSFCKLSAASV